MGTISKWHLVNILSFLLAAQVSASPYDIRGDSGIIFPEIENNILSTLPPSNELKHPVVELFFKHDNSLSGYSVSRHKPYSISVENEGMRLPPQSIITVEECASNGVCTERRIR